MDLKAAVTEAMKAIAEAVSAGAEMCVISKEALQRLRVHCCYSTNYELGDMTTDEECL